MKRLVAIAAILLVGAGFSILIIGWLLGKSVQRSVGSPPQDFNAEPVSFASDTDTIVHGWWCTVSNSHGAVLLLPGIRADRVSMIGRARFLRHAGYSVLLIDFRATGETKGDHITFGGRESRDVLAAVDFIRKQDSNNHIAIIGSSLGGAAALLATPPLKVDALVLEAVYPTIDIATRNRLENYLGSWGRFIAPLLIKQLHPRLGISVGDLRPIDHVANVDCPVLIMSGGKDRNTRPGDTQMLFPFPNSGRSFYRIRLSSPPPLAAIPNRAASSELHHRGSQLVWDMPCPWAFLRLAAHDKRATQPQALIATASMNSRKKG